MGQARVDADHQPGGVDQRRAFGQHGLADQIDEARSGQRGDVRGPFPIGRPAQHDRRQAAAQPLREFGPAFVEPVLLRAGGKGGQDGGVPGDAGFPQQIPRPQTSRIWHGDVHRKALRRRAETHGEIPVLLADARIIHHPRNDLGHQPLAAFLRAQANPARGAAGPGPDAAFQQALQVQRQVVALGAQLAGKGGHFPGHPAVLTLLAQLLPVPAGQQMQAIQARIVAQQFAMRLLRQPGEVGFRPQASQGRDDARGHDDVADGAQANDEDAPG